MFAISGQPLDIAAKDWNELLRDKQQDRRSRGRKTQGLTSKGGGGNQLPQGWAWVRNDTGSPVNQFDVLALSAPIIFDFESFQYTRNETPDFKGITPTSSYYGKWGVLRAPAEGSTSGSYPTLVPAVISGSTWARATINDEQDVACEISPGSTTLVTQMHGSARILYKESGTGTDKAVFIQLGDWVTKMVGKADAAIASAASGTVSVWNGTAGSEADTGVNVTSYNRTGIEVGSGTWCKVISILGVLYVEPWECP
jgi:hypothetical protein